MDLFRIDVTDGVFLFCLLVGGFLLLVTVVLGEILDAVNIPFLDHADIVPPLMAFVALFGAGGLLGRQALGMASDAATFLALGVGTLGALGTSGLLRLLRRSEDGTDFRLEELVGRTGQLSTPIAPGLLGQVAVEALGGTQHFIAHASSELPAGSLVRIREVVAGRLVVEPIEPPAASGRAGPAPDAGSQGEG